MSTSYKQILNNHKNPSLSLYNNNSKIKLGILNDSDNFKWIVDTYIQNIKNELYLHIKNHKLILSKKRITPWTIVNNCLKSNEYYLSCDINYNIILTKLPKFAIEFSFCNNNICYNKPQLLINFEKYNNLNNIIIPIFNKYVSNDRIYNIAILLAAGYSSRFENETPKQLYIIDSIEIIRYSIIAMQSLNKILIITNNKCYNEIYNIASEYENTYVLINDVNCRLASINTGFKYICEMDLANIANIIIHDSARPFINNKHIDTLLLKNNLYSQYCMKLVNGLIKKNYIGEIDRDDYIELCSPLCIQYDLFKFIFSNYIMNNIVYEFIPILNILKIDYELLEDNYKYLRKITTCDDII